MSRELKFRAWDKNGDGMFYNIQEGIQFEDGSHYTFDKFLNPHVLDTHQWELMQFTGLKDKNGKEIYEGDTLKFFDRVVANVIYKDFGGWSFEWIDVTYKRIRHNPEPFFRNMNLFEVAGNIYENPDILSKSLTLEKV
jgi:uncharacterized phage protein (TIGR01671 family)